MRTVRTINVYSQKAEEIVKAAVASFGHECKVTRDSSGNIQLEGNYTWEVPELPVFFGRLMNRTHYSDRTNTIRTRAQDSRIVRFNDTNGNDINIKAKDVNLLACIVLQKYKEDAIRFWFGSKEYDEMVGKPFNPMVAAQRVVVIKQIEDVIATKRETSQKIKNDFNSQIKDLEERRNAALDESDKKFDLKLEELKASLDNLKSN